MPLAGVCAIPLDPMGEAAGIELMPVMPLAGVCAVPLEPMGEAAGIELIPPMLLAGCDAIGLPAMGGFPGAVAPGIPPMLVVGVGLDPIGAAAGIPPIDVVGVALGVFAIEGALVPIGIAEAAPAWAPVIPLFELPDEDGCDIALLRADAAAVAVPAGGADGGAITIAAITASETPACFSVIKAFGEVSNRLALF